MYYKVRLYHTREMERKKEFITNVVFYAVIFALIYLGVNYILPIVFPFILGFAFAYVAKLLTHHLFEKDTKLNRVVSLLIVYALIVLIAVVLVAIGIDNVITFISNLPSIYKTNIAPYIAQFQKTLIRLNESLPANIADSMEDTITSVFAALNTGITKLAGSLVTGTTNIIKSTPNVIISIMLTLITSFYMLADYETIMSGIERALPQRMLENFEHIKHFCNDVLFKIIGCYAIIMLLTFIELFVGFSLFGVSNGPLWAFLISFLDILPVLGVGTALIPWAIIALAIGDTFRGVQIGALYLIITLVRNVVEPKLVGGNLGLHPLLTLIAMMVGLNLLGVIGMFGFPLTLSFINSKYRNGN